MSTILNIAGAVGLGAGSVLPALGPVTFKNVFPWETKPSKSGDGTYTIQNAILSDGVNEIRAAFWDHPDLSDLRGQTRVIYSVMAKNNRKSGVAVVTGTFQNKPRWEIKVSRTALILPPGVEAPESSPALALPAPGTGTLPPPAAQVATQAAPPVAEPPKPSPAPELKKADPEVRPPAAPAPTPAPALVKTRTAVTHESLFAYYQRCWKDVTGLLPGPATLGQQGEYLQAQAAATATLFIQGTKEGLHVPQANPDDVPL